MKEERTLTIYDKSQIYEEKVKPLVDEIIKVSVLNELPIFIASAVSNSEKDTTYKYDGIFTGSMMIELFDDKLEKFLMVAQGADIKPITAINDFSSLSMDYINEGTKDVDEGVEPDIEELDNIEYIGNIL